MLNMVPAWLSQSLPLYHLSIHHTCHLQKMSTVEDKAEILFTCVTGVVWSMTITLRYKLKLAVPNHCCIVISSLPMQVMSGFHSMVQHTRTTVL